MAKHYGDTKIIEDAGGHPSTDLHRHVPIRHYPKGNRHRHGQLQVREAGGGFGPKWIYGNPEALVNRGR
jgi:hypothetical protein